jgi:hypothetical protein
MNRFAPLCFSLLLVFSCSFYDQSAELRVRLPDPPDHWRDAFPAFNYRIVYPLPATGGIVELIAAQEDEIDVEVPKLFNLPLLAYPILPERNVELEPAGGLYPLDYSEGGKTLTLSWEQGACTEVLLKLWMQEVDCSDLNTARLRREMQDRCRGDPWNLDLPRICSLLALRDFRVTDIRLAPSSDLALDPGPGLWFLESPFRAPVAVEEGKSLNLQQVTLGKHLLIDGLSGFAIILYVEENSLLWLPILPAPG